MPDTADQWIRLGYRGNTQAIRCIETTTSRCMPMHRSASLGGESHMFQTHICASVPCSSILAKLQHEVLYATLLKLKWNLKTPLEKEMCYGNHVFHAQFFGAWLDQYCLRLFGWPSLLVLRCCLMYSISLWAPPPTASFMPFRVPCLPISSLSLHPWPNTFLKLAFPKNKKSPNDRCLLAD